jgi:hypothetical protein
VPDYLRTYLLEQIAAWALARAVAAEDAAARLAADRAVLVAQRDALARKLAAVERRARSAEALAGVGRIWRALALGFPAGCADPAPAPAEVEHERAVFGVADAVAALPPSVLPIRLEDPTYRHAVKVALPGFIDRIELSVKL